jgi:hypothetical protein
VKKGKKNNGLFCVLAWSPTRFVLDIISFARDTALSANVGINDM